MADILSFVGALLIGVEYVEWFGAVGYLLVRVPTRHVVAGLNKVPRMPLIVTRLVGVISLVISMIFVLPAFLGTCVKSADRRLNRLLCSSVRADIQLFRRVPEWLLTMASGRRVEIPEERMIQALRARPVPFVGILGLLLVIIGFGLRLAQ